MVCANCIGYGLPEMIEIRRETQTQGSMCFMESEYVCKNCGRREVSTTIVRTIYEGKNHDRHDRISEQV